MSQARTPTACSEIGRKAARSRRKNPRTCAEVKRPSLYDEVTQRIVGELEAGRLPWVQPWGKAGCANVALPRNVASGRAYSGVNILILWGAVITRGYPSQDWITFPQAQKLGGCVRKGEHGVTIVYADRFTPASESERETAGLRGSAASPSRASERDHEPRTVPFLRRFTVFNLAQCDGLGEVGADPILLPEREIVPVGEQLIAASGVEVRIGGDRAFYAPGPDFVAVPPQPAFFHQIDYYRTVFHELTHATGHGSRLLRDQTGTFGSKAYAHEELIAEIGSAFLCASLGIVPTVRHADYIGGWLALLRGDNRAIFRAASAASKAADWLLARRSSPDDDGRDAA